MRDLTRAILRWAWLLGVLASAALLVCGSEWVGATDAAVTSAQPLAACAYGTDVRGLTGFIEGAVAHAAEKYAAALTSEDASTQAQTARVFAAGAAAYVYGLPQVVEHATVTHLAVPNEIVSVAAIATPQAQGVVAPDPQTAPSTAWFDLRSGPIVINVPDTNGLFYTFQFLDAFTNAFAYVGSGSTGTQAGAYALVPPGWSRSLPAGVTAIDAPTDTVWLIGRTLVQSPADLPTVKSLQTQYDATPLAAWLRGTRRAPVVVDRYSPSAPVSVPAGADFIATLNHDMDLNPPPAADRCALQAMSAAGVRLPIRAPVTMTTSTLLPTVASNPVADAAVTAGTSFGARIIATASNVLGAFGRAANNGWAILGPWVGDYGTRYLGRAIVAAQGLGANTPRQAIYPSADTDLQGLALNGSQSYTITFPTGELPPVRAFWALTVYNTSQFLTANPLDRYAVGDFTPGLEPASDGSLTIYLQNQKPTNPVELANWLPAPVGPFRLLLRLYQPQPAALHGAWKPPQIVPAVFVEPQLSGMRVAPGSFRPASRGGIVSATGPAKLTYHDTVASQTTFELISLRAHRRHVVVGRFTHQDDVGANSLWLRGRADSHKLAKGHYEIHALARSGPNSSQAVTAVFRIV